MSKPNEERLRELLDEARKARDTDSVKSLCDELFNATGVLEPEFAAVESSGNAKLDHLRLKLVEAIGARDDECEANLREAIKKIEGEQLPEVNVELTEEECEEVAEEDEVENPFAEREDEEVVDEASLTLVVEDYKETDEDREVKYEEARQSLRDISVEEYFKYDLTAEQVAPLRKAGLSNMNELSDFQSDGWKQGKSSRKLLIEIDGISNKMATAMLKGLGCVPPEDTATEEVFKDVLMATQISALEKADFRTVAHIRSFIDSSQGTISNVDWVKQINGIGKASAETILETLGYEA